MACFEWRCLGNLNWDCGWTEMNNRHDLTECPRCGGRVAKTFDEDHTPVKGMDGQKRN